MKNLSKKAKIIILAVAGALILALAAVLIFGGGEEIIAPEPTETPRPTQAVFELSKEPVSKEETVYVNLSPDGTVTKINVTDRLHSAVPQVRVEDKSDLKDISDVKSFISPVYENERMYWDMPMTDLYYSGVSQKAPPLGVSLKYTLDGKEISHKELAGKSGKVKIELNISNNLTKTVKAEGKSYTVQCPMLLLCGMLLPEDGFSEVRADEGIILGDGTRKLVFFVGVPGMNDSLGLGEMGLDFLGKSLGGSSYSVSAQAEDFALGNMMLVAVPFSSVRSLGMKDIPQSIEGLKSMLTDIDGLMEAFSSMNITELIDVLYGNAEKLGDLVSAVADATKLYNDNKVLLDVLDKYATDGNIDKLERVLEDMESINEGGLGELARLEPFQRLLELLGRLDKNLGSLAKLTRDYKELAPLIKSLNEDLSSPDVKKALDNMPQTTEKLRSLVSLLRDSEELIKKTTRILSSDSLQRIMNFTKALNSSESLGALSSAQEKDLALRTKAWLSFGESYDIFTQRTESTSSSLVFIYKTEAIG